MDIQRCYSRIVWCFLVLNFAKYFESYLRCLKGISDFRSDNGHTIIGTNVVLLLMGLLENNSVHLKQNAMIFIIELKLEMSSVIFFEKIRAVHYIY